MAHQNEKSQKQEEIKEELIIRHQNKQLKCVRKQVSHTCIIEAL